MAGTLQQYLQRINNALQQQNGKRARIFAVQFSKHRMFASLCAHRCVALRRFDCQVWALHSYYS